MALTHTFETTVSNAITLTAVYGYRCGWNDALTQANAAEATAQPQAEALSSSISDLHIDHLLPKALGAFHDDPTWDSFMRSIEEYRDQVDAFERGLE